jgi:hypothetical protein
MQAGILHMATTMKNQGVVMFPTRMLLLPVLALAFTFNANRPVTGDTNRPTAAQLDAVTTSDIQRLQDAIHEASDAVGQLRSRNAPNASQFQDELDNARDEVTYLSVKLRKNELVSRSEYENLRNRIETITSRARGENRGRSSRAPADESTLGELPAGTELDVRLQDALSSKTAQPEDRFNATTMVDLRQGDQVLVPAGSTVRGLVRSVNKAGRIERKGSLTVIFDQLTIHGRTYPIHATVTQALESEGVRGEVAKIGTAAGVGAIIGGIIGGGKGALAGILIGGGGVVAATEGKDVDLTPGSVLRIRIDSPLTVE